MLDRLWSILSSFRWSFTRQAAFEWFVVIVIGILAREDGLGETSIIRSLALCPGAYDAMMKFFRAASWQIHWVIEDWAHILAEKAPCALVGGRRVLIIDGVKQPKEAFYMPGVSAMVQESETQSKPQRSFGHLLGCVSLLVSTVAGTYAVPVSLRLHSGIERLLERMHSTNAGLSHVVRMIKEACEVARAFGPCFILGDRYFLSVEALKELERYNSRSSNRVDLITMAKKNAVAYLPPPPRKPGQRGAPRKKGDRVELMKLFDLRSEDFQTTVLHLYDDEKVVHYLCLDLLWGRGLYQPLRFVLSEYDGIQRILVSTDLNLNPLDIIIGYSKRSKIETGFRAFKQAIRGMAYHFWTKAMPKLKRYAKKSDPGPLDGELNDDQWQKIEGAYRAIEMHLHCSCVAMGIAQLMAIDTEHPIPLEEFPYQRTLRKTISERNVMHWVRYNILRLVLQHKDHPISRIIRKRQGPVRAGSKDKTA